MSMGKIAYSFFIFWLGFLLSGCLNESGKLEVKFREEPVLPVPKSKIQVTSVSIINHQLVLAGAYLSGVTQVRMTHVGLGFNESFVVESKDFNNLIANGVQNVTFNVGESYILTLTEPIGSVPFQVSFSLQNGMITTSKLHNMGAADGDLLTFNQTSGLWEARARASSGLNVLGAWNASTNNPTLADGGAGTNPDAGDFYIVGTSGSSTLDSISNWNAGDWILFNGTVWQRVANSSGIKSINGRQGAVVSQSGDYAWGMIDKTGSSLGDIGDVDTSSTPSLNSILVWNGTKWVGGADGTGGALGSVDSTTILDNSIVNADFNAGAGIAQSKIAGLSSTLATINASSTAHAAIISSLQSTISQLNASSSAHALDLGINASNLASHLAALDLKQSNLATGTTAQYYRGDKTWQTLNTTVVPEGSNLYFTEARVLGTDLAGYTMASSSPLSASDTLLSAFGKLAGQLNGITTTTSTGDFKKDGSVAMTGSFEMGTSTVRLKDNDGVNHFYSMRATSSMAADLSFVLPGTAGGNGYILVTNGAGVLNWSSLSTASGDITSVLTSSTSSGLSGGGTSGDLSLSVNVDNSSIELNGNNLQIKASGITNAKLASSGLDASKFTAGTLPDAVHSSSVSLLGASIDSSEIVDYTILNSDISSSTKISWSKIDYASATSGSFSAVPLTRSIATSSTSSGLSGGGDLSADRSLSVNTDATTVEVNSSNEIQAKTSAGVISASYTVTVNDRGKFLVVNSTSTLTLPTAASASSGYMISVKNISSSYVFVRATSTDLIDGYQDINLTTQYADVMLVSTGSGWQMLRQSDNLTYDCPTGFVRVPGNATLKTNDFCVMQFEARNNGSNTPTSASSSAGNSPWVSITFANAFSECASMSENGFDGSFALMSNQEWMTIARNIENLASNWSGGIVGSGHIPRGHSDNSPANALAITNLADPYNGTGNNSGQAAGSGWEQRRTHSLSNGSVLWDLTGNVSEILDWDYKTSGLNDAPTNASEIWRSVTTLAGSFTANDISPNGPYTHVHSFGQWYGGDSGGFLRGGNWYDTVTAGIYAGWFDHDKTGDTRNGFRCVYRPFY